MERIVYSAKELAELLGVNIKTVYEGIRQGEIPVIEVANRKLVPKQWLDRKQAGDAA